MKPTLPTPGLPPKLSARSVLGFDKPGTPDWAMQRGLQYAGLRELLRSRVVAHGVGAGTVALLFAHAHLVPVAIWIAALAALIYGSIQVESGLADTQRRPMQLVELRRHTAWLSAIGVVWATPAVYLALFGTLSDVLSLTIVSMILVTGSALAVTTPPLGTIAVTVVTTLGTTAAFLLQGAYSLAMVPSFFGIIIAIGTIEKSRTFLTARIAEAGMQEKDQVVSMLLREFEENGADWLWQTDAKRCLFAVSPRFAYALGCSPEEAEGRRFVEMIAGPAWTNGVLPESLHNLAEVIKRREPFSNLLVAANTGGKQRWWELSGTPVLDDAGAFQGFRGVGSDVTEQRESSERIAYLARYDTLTSLPNRLQLTEAMGEALRYSGQWKSRCAVLMLDLDRFKAVNDTLGHLIGDKLLAQVAERLRNLCSPNEVCGRLGGDEFAVVIHDLPDIGYLEQVAARIIATLTEPYLIDNHVLYVGTSVGSAVGPRDGRTVEDLMRNADLALYQAKGQGGGEHRIYEPALHALAEERRLLEASLRSALDNDELLLEFQPVVDANSHTTVSFEALVRWRSPVHGFVSPGKFIPLAEDTRLIVPIGQWVLREACRQASEWPEHIMVNVNVSPPQLLEPDFVASVQSVLRETGLNPARLELEVTESVFMSDPNIARAALQKLISVGCSIALDDFGTGYSSLGYLKTLSFSTIKIDRLFVQGAAHGNRESLAIIRAVVAMTESLGMSTTAEGVETADESVLIRSLGCTKIQGYHFGRPMSAGDATKLAWRDRRQRAPSAVVAG